MPRQRASLEEIVGRLVAAYKPLKIYLFGSTARGDTGPDSDIDILVIVPDDAPKELRSAGTGYSALRGTGVAVDLLVWPLSYFEAQTDIATSMPHTIAHEGKVLYAA